MAAVLPLSVLLLLSVTCETTESSQAYSVSGLARDLSAACMEGANRSVGLQIRTGQQEVVRKITDRLNDTAQDIKSGQQQTVQEILAGQHLLQEQLSDLQEQLTALRPVPDQCPTGWSHHQNSCYLMPALKTSWYQAQRECALIDRRARLASVHRESRQHIAALLSAGDGDAVHAWVGLVRLADDAGFGWTDGSPLDDILWKPGEPNNEGGVEDCGYIYGAGRPTEPEGALNDSPCSLVTNFLCQISLA